MPVTAPVENSLFLTPAWLNNWWRVWGGMAGFECRPLVLDADTTLPTYVDHGSKTGPLASPTLQFIGTNYRRVSTPRAEYLGLQGNNHPEALAAKLETQLISLPWSQWIVRDIDASAPFHDAVREVARRRRWYVRTTHDDLAYYIDTTGSYEAYLAGLGKNTRLRLHNRRTVLEGLGKLTFENAWPANVDGFFTLLNDFHVARWGQPCFGEKSLDFHLGVIRDLASAGGRIDLNVMRLDDKVISVLYNVVWQGRAYNIQAGFEENLHPKIALGSLHLGYAIEAACHAADAEVFDLLAGNGKNTDYKAHLCSLQHRLVSYQILRSPWLKLLYRGYDWVQARRAIQSPPAPSPD